MIHLRELGMVVRRANPSSCEAQEFNVNLGLRQSLKFAWLHEAMLQNKKKIIVIIIFKRRLQSRTDYLRQVKK